VGIRYSKSGQFGMELITVSFFLLLTLRFLVHFMAWVNMQNTVLFKKLFYCIFIPHNCPCFCSIQYVLSYIDSCIQYGEDADVKVRDFDPPEDDD